MNVQQASFIPGKVTDDFSPLLHVSIEPMMSVTSIQSNYAAEFN